MACAVEHAGLVGGDSCRSLSLAGDAGRTCPRRLRCCVRAFSRPPCCRIAVDHASRACSPVQRRMRAFVDGDAGERRQAVGAHGAAGEVPSARFGSALKLTVPSPSRCRCGGPRSSAVRAAAGAASVSAGQPAGSAASQQARQSVSLPRADPVVQLQRRLQGLCRGNLSMLGRRPMSTATARRWPARSGDQQWMFALQHARGQAARCRRRPAPARCACAITGPASSAGVTQCTLAPCSRIACGQRAGVGVQARILRQQRRMDVDHAGRAPLDDARLRK